MESNFFTASFKDTFVSESSLKSIVLTIKFSIAELIAFETVLVPSAFGTLISIIAFFVK